MPSFDLDRSSDTPVRRQLAEQLRYLIASGHYRVDDPLPSTRALGERLDLSFHTVRKAYQALEADGLLQSKPGSGYTVKERSPLPKEDRMERGAALVRNTLQRLIGLGLDDQEIRALVQEQANLLDHAGLDRKLIVVGPHYELMEQCADQLSRALQQTVRPVLLSELQRHLDADYAFTPHRHLPTVLKTIPRGDALGFVTHLPSSVLEQAVRLLEDETLGLVTRDEDTIAPLSDALRSAVDIQGKMVATSVDGASPSLEEAVADADLIFYTPGSYRPLRSLLQDASGDHAEVSVVVSQDAVDSIVEAVPA